MLREAITQQLNRDWPGTNLPDVSWGELDSSVPFDHVMYCMPPGTQMGVACKCSCAGIVDVKLRVNVNSRCLAIRL